MSKAPIYMAEACNNLGVIVEKRGQVAEALALYVRAAQRPGFAPAHYNQGLLFKRQGDLANAQKSFGAALEAQPDFPEACYSLGLLFQGQGKLAEAEAQYRRALSLRPGYRSAAARLSELQQARQSGR
jgi:Tfp pilus assembly protein PilF